MPRGTPLKSKEDRIKALKESSKKTYQKNRLKILEKRKKYRKLNPPTDKEKIYISKYYKDYYKKNKLEIIEKAKLKRELSPEKTWRYRNKQKVDKKEKEYYENNKEKIIHNAKDYYQKNKLKIKEKATEYYKNNRDLLLLKSKKYKEDNREEILQKQHEYREQNKQHLNERRKKHSIRYNQNRKLTEKGQIYLMWNNVRSRLTYFLKRGGKDKIASEKMEKIIGCNKNFLKEYLSSKFYNNLKTGEPMTWENYGKWHIDHIKPLTKFNPKINENLYLANNYKNLQPLWAEENLKKGNKF